MHYFHWLYRKRETKDSKTGRLSLCKCLRQGLNTKQEATTFVLENTDPLEGRQVKGELGRKKKGGENESDKINKKKKIEKAAATTTRAGFEPAREDPI